MILMMLLEKLKVNVKCRYSVNLNNLGDISKTVEF